MAGTDTLELLLSDVSQALEQGAGSEAEELGLQLALQNDMWCPN